MSYQYRFSLTDDKPAWLIRWEYYRQPPRPDHPYPLAHVHVNAELCRTVMPKTLPYTSRRGESRSRWCFGA
jgi:hypothetical protein